MKKTFIVIMLIAAVAVQAQTSRIMFGLGGGMTTNMETGSYKNTVGPMAAFNFGYAILDSVGNEGAMLGFRTGLNVSYFRTGLTSAFSTTFTNTDYDGSQMDYTISCDNVNYIQRQLNLELPLMFAIKAKGLYVNLGAKLVLPVWNRYEQTIDNPTVSVYYPEIGATIVNDPSTGMLSSDQIKMTGKANISTIFIGLSAEIGYTWHLKGSSNIGFDLFVDYLPWGFPRSKANNNSFIEISPIVNDCEQPNASVTVNTFSSCNNFNFQYLNFGAKLVYSFDITGGHH